MLIDVLTDDWYWNHRCIAGELGWDFMDISPNNTGSQFHHETVKNIAAAFAKAEKEGPTVIFLDEIEGWAVDRSSITSGWGFAAADVNALLVELNNAAKRGILVIAATNIPERLDPAFLRNGRMDEKVYVGAPDEESRVDLLKFYLANRKVSTDISYSTIAQLTEGFSPADIAFLVSEASRIAFKTKEAISTNHLVEAASNIPPSII